MRRTLSATVTDGGAAESLTLTPLSGNQAYSLYFHIPFCSKKCDYCHFYVIPDHQQHKELFMQALKIEWELNTYLLPARSPVSIYFGGGTPTLLGPKAISEILSWIAPTQPCEITLEANPENVTLDAMRAYRECGINRVSIGVQTLDDSLLKTLGRTHTATCAKQAVETCFTTGLHNISIDLMYDLPGQTYSSWKQTLSEAIELPLSHLSLYNLTIEPNTVFFKNKKKLLPTLPSSNTSLSMLEHAIHTFTCHDFKRYEISAFARNEHISMHNIGYWTLRPFLGFGPSAFSFWNDCRFRNISHLNQYAKLLIHGDDPSDFCEKLTFKESLKESLAVGLRCIKGVPISHWPDEIEKGIERLMEKKLLIKTKDTLVLSNKGLLFHDTVAEEIMSL